MPNLAKITHEVVLQRSVEIGKREGAELGLADGVGGFRLGGSGRDLIVVFWREWTAKLGGEVWGSGNRCHGPVSFPFPSHFLPISFLFHPGFSELTSVRLRATVG